MAASGGADTGDCPEDEPLGDGTEPPVVCRSSSKAGPVLVIEDDRLVRAALCAFLEELGCEVLAAASAAAALALIAPLTCQPRLLICDYGLPGGVDGLQAILSVRRELGSDFIACLMTGLVSSEVRSRCRENGIPLLYKPVSPATLRSIVRQAYD
jgi:CheY-like chemotaxis protein